MRGERGHPLVVEPYSYVTGTRISRRMSPYPRACAIGGRYFRVGGICLFYAPARIRKFAAKATCGPRSGQWKKTSLPNCAGNRVAPRFCYRPWYSFAVPGFFYAQGHVRKLAASLHVPRAWVGKRFLPYPIVQTHAEEDCRQSRRGSSRRVGMRLLPYSIGVRIDF